MHKQRSPCGLSLATVNDNMLGNGCAGPAVAVHQLVRERDVRATL
jgi:hypothetical protein